MTEKTAAKAPAKKATARKTTAKKTTPRKTAAKKTAAKKAPAKKTVAKKTTRPRGKMDVKVIHAIDTGVGRDTVVYFTDGSRAEVKRDSDLNTMLLKPESHAPALLKVTVDHGHITAAEPVDTHEKG